MKILSIGVGAIGTYVCGNLALAGNEVVFLERPQSKKLMEGKSLKITDPNGTREIKSPKLIYDLGEALADTDFDVAVLALKGYDLDSALSIFKPYAEKMPSILCLLNGVENEGKIAAVLGKEKVISGTVTTAVIKPGPGEIIIEKPRGIGLGGDHSLVKELAKSLNDAGIITNIYADAPSMKWTKMMTNLVCNATSAIFDKSPAEIYADNDLFAIEWAQLKELMQVVKKRNMKLYPLPGVPANYLGMVINFFPAPIARLVLAKAVGGGRGEKMPSFHIELHNGSGKSEVDNLNGAVVRAGKSLGIPTPVNRMLNETLAGMTDGSISQENVTRARQKLIGLVK